MRYAMLTLGASLLFTAAGAMAQAPGVGAADRDKMIDGRFKAADKDGDGKLTKDEAQAGMPRVAKHFDEIDKAHKGYLTVDVIKAAAARMMR